MSSPTPAANPRPRLDLKTLALFAVPVLLLAGVIAAFLLTAGAGLHVEPAAPIEAREFGIEKISVPAHESTCASTTSSDGPPSTSG